MVRDNRQLGKPDAAAPDVASASMGAYGRNRSLRRVQLMGPGPAWVAYHRMGPVVVALGDPRVGVPDGAWGRAWVVWYGASGSPGAPYGARRLGEEAVIRIDRFTLGGQRMRRLRSGLHIAARERIRILESTWPDLEDELRRQAWAIERSWRRRHPVRLAFSFSAFEDAVADERAWLLALKRNRVVAFITWLPSSDGRGLVGDLMRRDAAGAPGAMDLLVVRAIESARRRGLDWVSLGLVAEGSSLRTFKERFRPEWQPRSIAFPRGRFAEGVALAAVAAAHLSPARSHSRSRRANPRTASRRQWAARASFALIVALFLILFAIPEMHAAGRQDADVLLHRIRETPAARRAVEVWDHRPGHRGFRDPSIAFAPEGGPS